MRGLHELVLGSLDEAEDDALLVEPLAEPGGDSLIVLSTLSALCGDSTEQSSDLAAKGLKRGTGRGGRICHWQNGLGVGGLSLSGSRGRLPMSGLSGGRNDILKEGVLGEVLWYESICHAYFIFLGAL